MTQPAVSFLTQRAYDDMAPIAFADEENGWALLWINEAIAAMFDPIADIFRDRDNGRVGWTTLRDPALCPDAWLDWGAQWDGVRFDSGLTAAQKRLVWSEAAGRQRGRPDAVRAVPKPYLTGTKSVTLYERYGGNSKHYLVITYTAETAVAATIGLLESSYVTVGDVEAAFSSIGQMETQVSPGDGQVFAALLRNNPGGYRFTYRVDDGWSIGQMEAAFAGLTIAGLESGYVTIGDLETQLP